MYKGQRVAVVATALNEEKLVGQMLDGIPAYVDHVFLVDDGSTDRTAEIVSQRSRKDPRVILLQHPVNRGVGEALKIAYRAGVAAKADVLVAMAGDDQMDPLEMPKLLDAIVDGADYAKGNRLYEARRATSMPGFRRTGNKILSLLTRVSSGYWRISDPQNGYTAIRRTALEAIGVDNIYGWYGYPNDILAKMNAYRLKVVDVNIPARYGEEKSKIRYGRYIRRVSLLLARLYVWRIYAKYVRRVGRRRKPVG